MKQFDPADEKLEQTIVELQSAAADPEIILAAADEASVLSPNKLSTVEVDELSTKPWMRKRKAETPAAKQLFRWSPETLDNPQIYAGIRRRLAAYFIDGLIVAFVSTITTICVFYLAAPPNIGWGGGTGPSTNVLWARTLSIDSRHSVTTGGNTDMLVCL